MSEKRSDKGVKNIEDRVDEILIKRAAGERLEHHEERILNHHYYGGGCTSCGCKREARRQRGSTNGE